MKLSHHFLHNAEKYLHSDLGKIQSFVFLHNIGRSLVAVFIPIILLLSGFSIGEVLLYLLCYNFFDVIMNFVAREGIAKFGVKKNILFATFMEIIFFILLMFVSNDWGFIILLAFFMSLYDAFFWVGHWLIFNETIYRKKEVGKSIGIMNIVKQIANLVAPLVGALFLIFFDKNYLIGLTIIFIILSLIPLFSISDKHVKSKKGNFFKLIKDKEFRGNFFCLTLLGIHYQVEDILLPLFIYVTFSSIETVGSLPIILATGSIVFNYFIGKFVDRHEKLRIILIGALALMFVWLARLFFPMIETFFLTAIFVGFFVTMIFIPIDSILMKSSKGHSFLDVSTYRNQAYMWVNVPFYLILYLSVEVFEIAFAMSAFAMFIMVLLAQFLLKNKILKAQASLNSKKV